MVTTTEMRTVVGDFINMNQISCKLPESRDGALIQVSNDGQSLSENSYLHLVYDSRCFDCFISEDVMQSKCTLRVSNTQQDIVFRSLIVNIQGSLKNDV